MLHGLFSKLHLFFSIVGSVALLSVYHVFPLWKRHRTYRPEQIFVTQDTHSDNYLETNEGIEPWRG